jgi:AICAR transformylase/IMP cyclohydrolase PurH
MTRAALRYDSRHRHPAVSERDARRAWTSLLELATAHGDLAAQDNPVDRDTAAHLVAQIVRIRHVPFPLAHASARGAAEGFLASASAFATAVRPEDKAALGAFIAAGARCLDNLLTNEATRQAECWKRSMPSEAY